MPSQQDIERILRGRELFNKYYTSVQEASTTNELETKQPESLEELKRGLAELGFSSIDEFKSFDFQVCLEDLKESRKFLGTCDGCIDRLPRGCPDVVYNCRTQPDSESPTGRTPVTPKTEPSFQDLTWLYLASGASLSDYYKSFEVKKGTIYPIFPKCSIKAVITKEPALKWRWLL